MKNFRSVFVISYAKGQPEFYLPVFLDIIEHLAWLHRLDYRIHRRFEELGRDAGFYDFADLIHLRSTPNTLLKRKELEKELESLVLTKMMRNGCRGFFVQQKNLGMYPFPQDYISSKEFPHLEEYLDGSVTKVFPRCIVESMEDSSV